MIPDEVRIYAFGGTQHGPAADPPAGAWPTTCPTRPTIGPSCAACSTPSMTGWAMTRPRRPASIRGLTPALKFRLKTALSSERPPKGGTHAGELEAGGDGLSGTAGRALPEVIQQPHCQDYGPDFESGHYELQPPRPRGDYAVRVPAATRTATTSARCLPPGVPLATYTGWNLRAARSGRGHARQPDGVVPPVPEDQGRAERSGDPRRSMEERYGGFAEYQKRFGEACQELQKAARAC